MCMISTFWYVKLIISITKKYIRVHTVRKYTSLIMMNMIQHLIKNNSNANLNLCVYISINFILWRPIEISAICFYVFRSFACHRQMTLLIYCLAKQQLNAIAYSLVSSDSIFNGHLFSVGRLGVTQLLYDYVAVFLFIQYFGRNEKIFAIFGIDMLLCKELA